MALALRLILLLAFFTPTIRVRAQDYAFSQPYFAPLHLGPSLAGGSNTQRINLRWRGVWNSGVMQYRNVYFSYDQPVPKAHGGAGVYYEHQKDSNEIGFDHIAASANYSIISGGGGFRLATGGEFGIYQSKVNPGVYIPQDSNAVIHKNIVYPDMSLSIFAHGTMMTLGITGSHLNRPFNSFEEGNPERLSPKLSIVACFKAPLTGVYNTSAISVMFQSVYQGKSHSLNLGLMWKYKMVLAGIYYRNREAFIAGCGLQINKARFFYSYDFDLNFRGNSTHEFGIQIFLKQQSEEAVFPSVEHNGF